MRRLTKLFVQLSALHWPPPSPPPPPSHPSRTLTNKPLHPRTFFFGVRIHTMLSSSPARPKGEQHIISGGNGDRDVNWRRNISGLAGSIVCSTRPVRHVAHSHDIYTTRTYSRIKTSQRSGDARKQHQHKGRKVSHPMHDARAPCNIEIVGLSCLVLSFLVAYWLIIQL